MVGDWWASSDHATAEQEIRHPCSTWGGEILPGHKHGLQITQHSLASLVQSFFPSKYSDCIILSSTGHFRRAYSHSTWRTHQANLFMVRGHLIKVLKGAGRSDIWKQLKWSLSLTKTTRSPFLSLQTGSSITVLTSCSTNNLWSLVSLSPWFSSLRRRVAWALLQVGCRRAWLQRHLRAQAWDEAALFPELQHVFRLAQKGPRPFWGRVTSLDHADSWQALSGVRRISSIAGFIPLWLPRDIFFLGSASTASIELSGTSYEPYSSLLPRRSLEAASNRSALAAIRNARRTIFTT